MLIKFNKYNYIGNNRNSQNASDYAFNYDNVKSLVNKGQYFEAAKYLSQYVPNDAGERAMHYQYIDELKRQGKQYVALSNRAKAMGPDVYNKFEFIVNKNKGIEMSENNPYADRYNTLKRLLGSAVSYNGNQLFYPGIDTSNGLKVATTGDLTNAKVDKEAVFLEFRVNNDESTLDKAMRYGKNISNAISTALNPGLGTLRSLFSDDVTKSVAQSVKEKVANAKLDSAGKVITENSPSYWRDFFGITTQDDVKKETDLLSLLGTNDKELVDNGLEIKTLKDGTKTIRFNKDNPLADKLIYNYISNQDVFGDSIIGYDINGNPIDNGVQTNGDRLMYNLHQKAINSELMNFLSDTVFDDRLSELYRPFSEEREYTATVGGPIFDELAHIYPGGEMTKEQAQAMDAVSNYVFSTIHSLGATDTEMYASGLDEQNIDTLHKVENAGDRLNILNLLATKDLKDMTFEAYTANGVVGTLISFTGGAKKPDDLDSKTPITEATNDRLYHVFIPGLFQEQAQAKLDKDTQARGVQEINDMDLYGYNYTTNDDITIAPDNNGGYTKIQTIAGRPVSKHIEKDEALKYIVKDKIIEDAVRQLPFAFMNVDGQITDYEGYKNRAQIAAFKSQYELYPNQPLVDIHGNPIGESNWQDVFDKRKFRPDNTPIDVWEQIVDMRDIYTKIMEQLNYYK